MTLAVFLSNYGYPALVIGTFLEGETILVLGGVAAHQGYLSLTGVILSAFAGSLAGDQLFFFLGWRHGGYILKKRPGWHQKIIRVHRWIADYENAVILLFRFVYGFRTVTPFVLGMARVRVIKFIILNSIGALTWAVVVATAGYLFGKVVQAVLSDIRSFEKWLLLAAAALGGLVWLIHFLRGRRNHEGPGDDQPSA